MTDISMPRKSVIAKVAAEQGISKVEAERIVRSVLAAVAMELAQRGRFHIAEVGSVTVLERRPRRYFNPRTGANAVSLGDQSLKINISKQMRHRLARASE